MRFLISTIIRNRGIHVPTWADQLIQLTQNNRDAKFDLFLFENDSTDNTKQALNLTKKRLAPYFQNINFDIQDCGWPYFNSIKAEERVRYLAMARNRTIEKAHDLIGLDQYYKIICIEPDAVYHAKDISRLLYTDLDIVSGYSFLPNGQGVKDWIYDSWATRVNADDSEYHGPVISELPELLPVASTFNCFCVYKPVPFIEGIRFSDINPRTNEWDCDTANICFAFSSFGYDKIGMCRIPILHQP